MLADDDDDSKSNNRMKVLIDGDGMKLLMDVWQEYVSDDDYINFPEFMRKVDNLLLGFRGGKPLTREERAEMNESPAPKKRGKKKKKAAPPTDDAPPVDANPTPPVEVTSSDNRRSSIYAGFIGAHMQGRI